MKNKDIEYISRLIFDIQKIVDSGLSSCTIREDLRIFRDSSRVMKKKKIIDSVLNAIECDCAGCSGIPF